MNLQELRQNYALHSLDENDVDNDPIVQFKQWMKEAIASEIPEPNAMTLGTVTPANTPATRIVLLKEVNPHGHFVFFTNYNSDKATEIANNPNVSLLFLWLELQRQVRIEGKAIKIPKAESEAYFQSRPKDSQIGTWVSPQSSKITSRAVLEEKTKEISVKYAQVEVLPLPDFWGGYAIEPSKMEFWQGRMSRLHDRVLYEKTTQGTWQISRLAP